MPRPCLVVILLLLILQNESFSPLVTSGRLIWITFTYLISLFVSEVRTLSFFAGYSDAIELFIQNLTYYTSGNWLSLWFRGSNIFHPNHANALEALNRTLKNIVRRKKTDVIGFVEKVRHYLQVHSLCCNALNGIAQSHCQSLCILNLSHVLMTGK